MKLAAINQKFGQYYPKIFRRFCSQLSGTAENDLWKSVVGLEVHAQINSKSKLFSSSQSVFGSATNTEVSYFDAALPGTLPVLNKYCIEAAIKTALALDCKINTLSSFDRKHYFYPDLPAGYQITQQFNPIASNGKISFIVYDKELGDPHEKISCLKQLQLEQDSGRTFHVKGEKSFVDLNRAGIGLMELVFQPDLSNGKEAAALVKELILILKRIDTCSCEMEEGTLRVDANISVHRPGEPLGVRTEVKNLNSLRYVARAIDFEIDRQIKLLKKGDLVVNETRAYDTQNKVTVFMRDKEVLQDYRFMPEPNLPPICLEATQSDKTAMSINDFKDQMPVLPHEERITLMSVYKLSLKHADKLVNHEGAKDKFEAIASFLSEPDAICEFLFDILYALLNVRQLSFKSCPLTAKQLVEIVNLLKTRTITEATAVDVLEMLFEGDQRTASDIVRDFNWYQINDEKQLEAYCHRVMAARPKMVKKYKNSGKQRYMTSLLTLLYEITNNRAPYKESEKMFKQLIMKNEQK
ncbi:glutamyl-tRNA(Gln) amidotransferase subunit B, mitochondrial [Parasteatoda tepidariorum]|uniref:glutamyl-tRNA(Gln) amidotransferase subunit B, mitochondrial n=1 Tax=Parasteatoda tepidariorum TaxID=114398 RepID=UPI0039BD0E73